MTRSITPITAASNGDQTTASDDKLVPEHGVAVLRHKEGRGLISLAHDALHETSELAHEMHAQLYAADPADDRELLQLMGEVLACLETGQHYLLMLSSISRNESAPVRPARTSIRGRWSPRSDPIQGAGPRGRSSPGPAKPPETPSQP
jgi:hypothetical protein